jgi:ATP-binding cassette subfamily F protein 3
VVHRLEADKSNLQAALADPKLYDEGKSDKLVNLRKRLSQAERDLKSAEESWVSLHEKWEGTP